MKYLFAILVLSTGLSAFAQVEQVITVKDRLRYDLWYNGVSFKKKGIATERQRMPEELSRAIRKF